MYVDYSQNCNIPLCKNGLILGIECKFILACPLFSPIVHTKIVNGPKMYTKYNVKNALKENFVFKLFVWYILENKSFKNICQSQVYIW